MAREAACYVLIGGYLLFCSNLVKIVKGTTPKIGLIAFIMAPKAKRQKLENSNDMKLRDAFKASAKAKASPPTADVNDLLATLDFGTWRQDVVSNSKAYYGKRKDKWWQELFETVLACKKDPLIGSFEAKEGIDANSFWTTNPKEMSQKFDQYVKDQGGSGIGIGEGSKAKPEQDEDDDDPMQGDEAADPAGALPSETLPEAGVSEEAPVAAEDFSEALPAETLPEVAAPAEVADLAEAASSETLPEASVSEEVTVATDAFAEALPEASVSEEVTVATDAFAEALPAETLPEVAAPAEVANLAQAVPSGTLPEDSVSEEAPVAAEALALPAETLPAVAALPAASVGEKVPVAAEELRSPTSYVEMSNGDVAVPTTAKESSDPLLQACCFAERRVVADIETHVATKNRHMPVLYPEWPDKSASNDDFEDPLWLRGGSVPESDVMIPPKINTCIRKAARKAQAKPTFLKPQVDNTAVTNQQVDLKPHQTAEDIKEESMKTFSDFDESERETFLGCLVLQLNSNIDHWYWLIDLNTIAYRNIPYPNMMWVWDIILWFGLVLTLILIQIQIHIYWCWFWCCY